MSNSAIDIRKTAAKTPLVRFWELHAGVTTIRDNRREGIYRPEGMEGWVVNCTTEGSGCVNHGSERFECTVGDVLLFPEGVVHDYGRADGASVWVHQWAHYLPRPTWQDWTEWPEVTGGVRRVRVADSHLWERIVQRLRDVADLNRDLLPHRLDLCMNAIEEILLWVDTANSPAHGMSADRRIHETVRFLRENYRGAVTIDALARRCALSPSRFAHLFREQTGVSPMRYVERLRVARAQELLLTTNTSIAEVAYQCGYENPLYFSHVFKRSSGRSPRSFRKGSAR